MSLVFLYLAWLLRKLDFWNPSQNPGSVRKILSNRTVCVAVRYAQYKGEKGLSWEEIFVKSYSVRRLGALGQLDFALADAA